MAIATYADLVKLIKRWLNRVDLEDEDINSFIYFAGASANQVLRVPAMEWTEILEVSEGGKIIIPSDYLELRSLTAEWNSEQSVPLERVAWDQYINYRNRDHGTQPRYFARQGPYLWITPTLAEGSLVTMHYYRTLPDISPEEPVNWLSDLSPMSYLFGALHYAQLFLMNEERAEYWKGKYQMEIERIQQLAESAEYKGSALTVRLKETSEVR